MNFIEVLLAIVFMGGATIGLLLLAIAFVSGWEWAYRVAFACGALWLLSTFWINVIAA